jgi:hypothetical protein
MYAAFTVEPHEAGVRYGKRSWRKVVKPVGSVVNIRLPARRTVAQKRQDDLDKMRARRDARRQRRKDKAWTRLGTTPQEIWANRDQAIPPGEQAFRSHHVRRWTG